MHFPSTNLRSSSEHFKQDVNEEQLLQRSVQGSHDLLEFFQKPSGQMQVPSFKM
jgi:hypothetical protein